MRFSIGQLGVGCTNRKLPPRVSPLRTGERGRLSGWHDLGGTNTGPGVELNGEVDVYQPNADGGCRGTGGKPPKAAAAPLP